jgi:hypothetical protein
MFLLLYVSVVGRVPKPSRPIRGCRALKTVSLLCDTSNAFKVGAALIRVTSATRTLLTQTNRNVTKFLYEHETTICNHL